jgi:hypothetical protein
MNHWKIGQLPYSWNLKNKTVHWIHTDNIDNFNKHPRKDLWDNINIEYQYNPQGFRTYDLTRLYNQKINIALGCSLTEGIGLPATQSWPSIIEQLTEFPMLNLGIGSGSTDTVARILTNVCSLYDIQTVYIFWPSVCRFETINKQLNIKPMLPHLATAEHTWYMDANISKNRFYKNQSIVQNLSKIYNFKIIEQAVDTHKDPFNFAAPGSDLARDGQHLGIQNQKLIAITFQKHLTN